MGIKINGNVGSTTLESGDTTDETVTITKAQWDKLEAIDPKSLATAWVRFNGPDGVILDSYNVSNVTLVTGTQFELTLVGIENINYCLSTGGMSQINDGNSAHVLMQEMRNTARTTTKVTIRGQTTYGTTALTHLGIIEVVIHGGKN